MITTDKEALSKQLIPWKYINDLKEIIDNCKKEFGTLDSCDLAIGLFNYGVIVGKRQERAKHKSSGSKN